MCPVVAVPFHPDGTLDLGAFESVVSYLIASGVSAVTLFGLASEFHKLTDQERDLLASALLKQTRSERHVLALLSVTDHATEVAVERALAYVEAGADALMVLPPFFLSPTEAAIVEHVATVVSAVPVPVIVQYAPIQTGVRLDPETWVNLQRDHPNLVAVKVETQPPGRYITALREASAGTLGSLVGYAGVQLPDALRRGAAGVQPGCSFVEVYLTMIRRWDAGDEAGFAEIHSKLLPYVSYWMQNVELIVQAEKAILQHRGLIGSDRCRRPGYTLDAEEHWMIKRFMHEFAWLLSGDGG